MALLGALSFAALAAPAVAQDGSERPVRSSDVNGSFWFKSQTWDYFNNKKKLGYSFDIIVRRQAGYEDNNIFRHRLRESIRPWFVWLMDPLNKLSIAPLSYHYDGGVRAIEANRDGSFRPELRSTIELDAATFLHDRIMLNNRVRFELRHYFPFTDDYRFLIRLRLRPRLRVSLNNKNYYDTGVIYAFGYSELALHTGSIEDVPNVFNQSRNFLGGGYRFKKYMRVDAGYIYQFNSRNSGTEYLVNHGLMTYFQIDYLTATLRDISNGIRERRIRREIGEEDLEIDPAILQATGPERDPSPTDDPVGPETPSAEGEPGARPDPDASDEAVRPPWWRRILPRSRRASGDDGSDDPSAASEPEPDAAPEASPEPEPDAAPDADPEATDVGAASAQDPVTQEPDQARVGLWQRLKSAFRPSARDEASEGPGDPEVPDDSEPPEPSEPPDDET